jgi:drug/metabolite transporter (DMT)-like permease
MSAAFRRIVWNRAWLVLVLTTMLWGGNGVASRLAVGRISPMSLVFLRWLIVCLLLGFALRRDLAANRAILQAHWRKIALMAGFGFTGFTVLFYLSAYWTTAVNITLMQAAIPPLVLAGAALSGKSRITPMQVVGLAVTIFGVIIIATRGEPLRIMETQFNIGDILILISCIFYAGYTLGLRERPAVPPLVFFVALAFAALVTSTPFMLAEVVTGRFFAPTLAGLGILTFVTLGPSLASQLLYMRGVELMGPARAGLFTNLTPIFGALFAVLLLGEDFHVYHAVALCLALGGIWLAERGRR